MTHDFPTIQEVLVMHDALISAFGGIPGVRDEGALAAALMESLANNHPFIDGNKRAAFFVTDTFLRLNGRFIDCDDDEAYAFFMGNLEAGTFRFAGLKAWLQDKVAALPGVR